MRAGSPARRGAALGPLVLAGVVLLLYAPMLGRGFTSEDFLLLRVLGDEPAWRHLAALFTEPWLGIEVVRFYRPVGELLLSVEASLFGGRPLPYNLTHTLLHALNVVLLWAAARRCLVSVEAARESRTGAGKGGRSRAGRVAFIAALLFAVHPLHPNAVSWIASYATLFAGTFVFASWWLWERLRGLPAGVGRWLLLAVLFAAALGSYEAAVVLPAALAAREILLPRGDVPPGRWLGLALPSLLAGLYLLLRRAVLGDLVGGYQSFTEDLLADGPTRLAANVVESLRRLVHPVFDPAWPAWIGGVVLAIFVVLPAVTAWRAASPRDRLGWLAFGWAWTLLFLAPFAFRPFVPANGRFVYLAAVGVVLVLASLADGVGGRARVGTVRLAVLVLVGVHWAVLLLVHGGWMRGAAEQAASARDELLRVAATDAAPGPLLVADPPLFTTGPGGVPRAQVLRYGLSDAVAAPFVETPPAIASGAVATYPLPAGAGRSAAAAFAAAAVEVRLVRWRAAAEVFAVQQPDPVPGSIRAVLRADPASASGGAGTPAEPTVEPTAEGTVRVVVEEGGAALLRLVVLTRGNPTVTPLRAQGGTVLEAAWPDTFVRSMTRLYRNGAHGGPVWWWVEARAADGTLQAVSPARQWPEHGSEDGPGEAP